MIQHFGSSGIWARDNAIERAVAFAEGSRIELEDLPEEVIESAGQDLIAGTAARTMSPGGDSSETRVLALWQLLTEQDRSFWDVVREPFLRRELSRDDLRKLVEHGLADTRGSYKKLAERFHVGDQYKKFHAFLKNSGCHVARERFAQAGEDD